LEKREISCNYFKEFVQLDMAIRDRTWSLLVEEEAGVDNSDIEFLGEIIYSAGGRA